jgi:hypothetical protein
MDPITLIIGAVLGGAGAGPLGVIAGMASASIYGFGLRKLKALVMPAMTKAKAEVIAIDKGIAAKLTALETDLHLRSATSAPVIADLPPATPPAPPVA